MELLAGMRSRTASEGSGASGASRSRDSKGSRRPPPVRPRLGDRRHSNVTRRGILGERGRIPVNPSSPPAMALLPRSTGGHPSRRQSAGARLPATTRGPTRRVVALRGCEVATRAGLEGAMCPTVFRERGFRFYFFSREENRMHVHVRHADGEVDFWMAPRIEIAKNLGLDPHPVRTALDIVHEHQEEILEAWHAHFAT